MALGDYDNNNRKFYEPLVYATPYNVSNTDGVDPSALSFQFFRGMLKISISPMKSNTKPGDKQVFDHDNAASVWLTAVKAKMLLAEIENAQKNPDSTINGGVLAGEGLISFSSGKELGVTTPCLIIRKLNLDTGAVLTSYAYQFKTDYHYAIRNFDATTSDFMKIYYNDLEVDMFKSLLASYIKAISGSFAYATLYAMKYDIQKNNTKIGMIMDKLGIEKPEYNNSSRQSYSNSFFNRNEGSGSQAASQQSYMNAPESGDMQKSTYNDLMQDMPE